MYVCMHLCLCRYRTYTHMGIIHTHIWLSYTHMGVLHTHIWVSYIRTYGYVLHCLTACGVFRGGFVRSHVSLLDYVLSLY